MPTPPDKKHSRQSTKPAYSQSLFPEPGQWLIDLFRTTGQVNPPEDLPREPLTVRQVRDYVSYEGLGFCIWDYLSPEKIADKRLATLWRQARETMLEIVDYMDEMQFPRKQQRKVEIGNTISKEKRK